MMAMMMMSSNASNGQQQQQQAHNSTAEESNRNNQIALVGSGQANGASGGGGGPKPRGRRKKVRTEPIRPVCPQCEKQFSNQSALTKHKLTHSDERKFACQQCSKAFKRHDHLTGHMQTHSNRKPFNCDVQGCDKTYCDARSLRRHKENIHHIVTPKENQNSNTSSSTCSGATTDGACSGGGVTDDNALRLNHQHQYGGDHQQHQQQHQHQQQQQQHQHQQQQHQQLTSQHHQQQITQQDMNNNNSSNNNINHHHYEHHQQPQQHTPQPINGTDCNVNSTMVVDHQTNNTNGNYYQQQHRLVSNNSQMNQPSELYKRRLHRLHSDGGGVHDRIQIKVDAAGHLGNMGQPPPNTLSHHPVASTMHHHHPHHQHPHASYSADYASTTTFFGPNYIQQHQPIESSHIYNGTSLPHSADSVNDSALGLNNHQYGGDQQQHQQLTPQLTPDMNSIGQHHYEQQQQPQQHTPQPVNGTDCNVNSTMVVDQNNNQNNSNGTYYHQPPPPPPQQQHHRLVLPPSNGSQVHQPSELYKRRLHRLHSDGGGFNDRIELKVEAPGHLGNMGQQPPNTLSHHSVTSMHQHQHQQYPHASYSADYSSTTTFFGQSYPTIESSHAFNGTSLPHSADSVTDSGLALNIHYEQQQFDFSHS